MKSQLRSFRNSRLKQSACTVSAAALMLGVSHAATVAMHFQENYCGAPAYSGFPVTITAFGVAPSGWQNLMEMQTAYSTSCDAQLSYTLTQTVSTNTSTGGLNPLPKGTLNVTWSANGANFSGFAGYGGSPPSYAYDGPPPSTLPTGEWQIYNTFLRDGVNFGVVDANTDGAPCGDNNQPGYSVDITGLHSVFSNPFVVELIASSDSMQALTNAFIMDVTGGTSNSVTYPNTPVVTHDEGGTCNQWLRGHGGGLSTFSAAMNTDHIKITSNRPQHGGVGVPPTGFDNAGTISGFIITDKPVVTMSPQPISGYRGDSAVLSAYAIGVPPLTYQWRRNGVPIPGANGTSYSVGVLNGGNLGNYDMVASNAYGTATSAESAVTLHPITETRFGNLVADTNPANPERDGINNGATWAASNSDGIKTRSGVMQFNPAASNGIVVTGSTNFDTTTGTFMFWMRSPGTYTANGGGYGGAILGRPGDIFYDSLFCVETDNGTLLLNTPGQLDIQTVATVSDNKWHLIAATFDGDTGGAAIYVDGVLDTTNNNGVTWAPLVGQPVQIGFSTIPSPNNTEYYNGSLDDVRIYNRQLTAAEIATTYANGSLIDTNALQMQLNFTTAPVNGLELIWDAPNSVLQSAPVLTGPYKDLPGATSPYYVVPSSSQRYFRYHFDHTGQTLISNPYLM